MNTAAKLKIAKNALQSIVNRWNRADGINKGEGFPTSPSLSWAMAKDAEKALKEINHEV